MQRTLARHKTHKLEPATHIQEVSKLEIEIMKERLSSLFLNTAFKYAKAIHIMETLRRTTDKPPQGTSLVALRRRPCLEPNSR